MGFHPVVVSGRLAQQKKRDSKKKEKRYRKQYKNITKSQNTQNTKQKTNIKIIVKGIAFVRNLQYPTNLTLTSYTKKITKRFELDSIYLYFNL